MGVFYLFKHDGIFQYDAEVPKAQYDQGRRAGDIRWLDLDNNGIINDDDRVVMGSSNPDFFGGWSNTFSWKGLSLDIFFTYMYGNDVYSGQEPNMSKLSHRDGLQYDHAINRWTGPGSTNVWPRALNGDNNNTRNSDFFLHDGSFIRLRTLTLAYQFPSSVVRKMAMKGLELGFDDQEDTLIKKVKNVATNVLDTLKDNLEDTILLNADVKANLQSARNGLKSGITAPQSSDQNTSTSKTQNVVFNQTINSPKAVSRLELYRKTNSLLFSAKGGLKNV